MVDWLSDIDVEDLFKLTPEERVKVVKAGVDLIFQECIITSQVWDIKASVLLNKILIKIDEQIKVCNDTENFELSYYLTEIKWETTNRLDNLRKEKGNVFL